MLYQNHVIKRKKVLFISTFENISGAERSLLDILNHINQSKYECFVVTSSNRLFLSLLPGHIAKYELKLKWFRKSYNPFYLFSCLINILINSYKIALIISKSNIQIICVNTAKAGIYGLLPKLISGCKLIFYARDNVNCFYRFLYNKADKIICISDYIYHQTITSDNKKAFIPVGINIDKVFPGTNYISKIRREICLKEDTIIIAQVAQITKWKNHFDFLNAAGIILGHFNNIHFIFIGDCISKYDIAYKNALLQKIKYDCLETKVSFLGFQENINDIMRQIDILLHPVIGEPFGRVIIEAMASGKAVVAYDDGGPSEIIKHNINGILVPKGDYREMALQSINLIKDSLRRKKLGEAARKHVVDNYNIQNIIQKFEGVIESM